MPITEQQLIDFLPHIKRYAKLFSTIDSVDDLVQMAATRIWQKRHLYKEENGIPASNWMGKICHNVWISRKTTDRWSRNIVYGEGSTRVELPNVEHCLTLNRAIDKLNNHPNGVLLALIATGNSYDEAAEKLNIPIGTIRSRISRTREKLKREIM